METPKPLRPEDLFGCPDHQALPWANRRMLNMRHVRQNMWLPISQVAGDVIFPCICHVPVTHGCLLLSEAMYHPAETGPGLLHLQTHTFSWDCSSQREDLELPSDDFLIHENMKRNTQPQSWDAVFQLPSSPPDSSHSCSLTHPPGLPATSGTFWLSITPYFQATCNFITAWYCQAGTYKQREGVDTHKEAEALVGWVREPRELTWVWTPASLLCFIPPSQSGEVILFITSFNPRKNATKVFTYYRYQAVHTPAKDCEEVTKPTCTKCSNQGRGWLF